MATAAILPYARFGYVAMVLVSPALRHRKIATRLLRDAVAALQAQGRTPMLDATPAGSAGSSITSASYLTLRPSARASLVHYR